ncbi:MAG: hypothetical protein ACJ8C4_09675 [Gemmataceae bacterium]
MTTISADLRRDRDAFLQRVYEFTDDRPYLYPKVIDDLIEWSLERSDKLYHCPRTGDQDVVRFRVVGLDQVFWIAYPRKQKKDAKLIALEDDVAQTPKWVRDDVRKEFIAFRHPEREEDEEYPTLSFRHLLMESRRRKIFDLMDRALNQIRKSVMK